MSFSYIADIRVSEPACFGMAPSPEIFNLEPAPAPGKREQKFGFFLTDYQLSKIRSNTCTSTYTVGPNLDLL